MRSINTFGTMLNDLAKQNRLNISSDIHVMPNDFNQNYIRIGEISIGTNEAWKFTISVINGPTHPTLVIRASGATLDLSRQKRLF